MNFTKTDIGDMTAQQFVRKQYKIRNNKQFREYCTKIGTIWNKKHGALGGLFIRFIDGNINNVSFGNLQMVHPFLAFLNIDKWVVDWDIGLTKKMKRFVFDMEMNFNLYTRHYKEEYKKYIKTLKNN